MTTTSTGDDTARIARSNRVRAREARARASAWEYRAQRVAGSSTMYLREARRLRVEAAALEVSLN